jgi:hypothetical protein
MGGRGSGSVETSGLLLDSRAASIHLLELSWEAEKASAQQYRIAVQIATQKNRIGRDIPQTRRPDPAEDEGEQSISLKVVNGADLAGFGVNTSRSSTVARYTNLIHAMDKADGLIM